MVPYRSKFYQPDKKLRKHIRFYLDVEIDGEIFRENPTVNYPTIYPAINIIFSDDTNDFRVGKNVYTGYRLFVGGITRLPGEFITFNKIRLITVFFYPTGLQHIFNISIAPLSDCFTELGSIDGSGAPLLLERVMRITDDNERVRCLDDYFIAILDQSSWNNNILDRAADLILEKKANIKVGEVARDVGVPERTLRRYFKNEMGVSIKEFIDIARINFASVILTSNPEMKIHEIIHMLGYYDQSHLIRHLKKYVSVSCSGINDLRKTFLLNYSDIEMENPVKS